MQRAKDTDESAVLQHLEIFLEYVQSNVAAWRAAPAAARKSSEGPALPPSALQQLASIGAEATGPAMHHPRGASRREREMANIQRLAAEKAQHQGFPKLPPSRRGFVVGGSLDERLDGTLCYYCQKRFPSRMALFAHLRRLIDKEHWIEFVSFKQRTLCGGTSSRSLQLESART
eukprot:symbB.v1.2.018871.t1/scaffold1522.1/size113888/2